jgi:hypothetical protein
MEAGCYGLLVSTGLSKEISESFPFDSEFLSFHTRISARMSSTLTEMFHYLISPSE